MPLPLLNILKAGILPQGKGLLRQFFVAILAN